jgi:hypothetical protein
MRASRASSVRYEGSLIDDNNNTFQEQLNICHNTYLFIFIFAGLLFQAIEKDVGMTILSQLSDLVLTRAMVLSTADVLSILTTHLRPLGFDEFAISSLYLGACECCNANTLNSHLCKYFLFYLIWFDLIWFDLIWFLIFFCCIDWFRLCSEGWIAVSRWTL